MEPYHVIVKFGSGTPADIQAKALMALEKVLRRLGVPAEVFKETMPDDSKLRSKMTPLERSKL